MGMTPQDVAALAAAQMRAARAAYDARLAWQRAREACLNGAPYDTDTARAHRDAHRAVVKADRAYQAACRELLAETLEPAPVEQPGLFDDDPSWLRGFRRWRKLRNRGQCRPRQSVRSCGATAGDAQSAP